MSTDQGIFHSVNSGTTFSAVAGPTAAWAIALGAPKTAGGYPALFAAANIGGVGYFRWAPLLLPAIVAQDDRTIFLEGRTMPE